MQIFSDVNRVELIVDAKRKFVTYDAREVMIDLQDNEKTLKVFLKLLW